MVVIKVERKIILGAFFVIAIVFLLIGLIFGNLQKDCPKPKDYCYDKDPEYYVGNPVSSLPSDWTVYVVGQNVGMLNGQICMNVNPSYSSCYISSICPNCVNEKVSCVCKK